MLCYRITDNLFRVDHIASRLDRLDNWTADILVNMDHNTS